jgi:gliding motility-associated-like protein
MRSALFTLMMIICHQAILSAQTNTFGNEWINYSQSYYKIKVAEDGIFRVTRKNMDLSGVNLSSVSSGNIRVYNNGQEIPVYVHVNAGTVEYIEFYGKKNRGSFDLKMYANPAHHFNPEYSLITDTSAYFLTFSTSGSPKRFVSSTANLNGLPIKESYYLHSETVLPANSWQPGKQFNILGETMSRSSFEYGEGWGTNASTSQNLNIPTSNINPNGPNAIIEVRMYSEGNVNHSVRISAGSNSYTNSFYGDSVMTHRFNVSPSTLNPSMSLGISGLGGSSDIHSVSYASINYPRNFDFEGKSIYAFKIAAGTARKFLEIQNFRNSANTQNIYLYDITNGLRIKAFWDGTKVLVDLPASSVERELVLVNITETNAVKMAPKMELVRFNNYRNSNANYIIIAHKAMFRDSRGFNPVLEYAAYRSTTGLSPVTIDVQEIYDQFGYGLNMHPQALRNFASFVKQYWAAPKYIFLVGKGKTYNAVRNFNTYDHLIPSFGNPASDNIMFAATGSYSPQIPVGRLSITNGDELRSYLNKIRAMENSTVTVENSGWQKNIIHLGGGSDDAEKNYFSNLLNSMKSNIERGKYGAKVHSFFKNQAEANENGSSNSMDSLINNGVSMITYLGHATPTSFDYNAYLLERYNNEGKYPLFLSMSCTNGGIFNEGQEMSERFVLAPNSGAIAYLGFSRTVAISAANYFGNEFYNQLSGNGYGSGAADVMKRALDVLSTSSLNSIITEMGAHSLIYHGDPAFNINAKSNTDFTVDENSMRTAPESVNTKDERFNLLFDIHNLGNVVDTTLNVDIYQKNALGDSILVESITISAPKNKTTISVEIETGGIKNAGINRFIVRLDKNNRIVETPAAAELNNEATLIVKIDNSEITPIFPYDFSMLPSSNVTLMASTGDPLASSGTYVFEIDTNANFNSPMLSSSRITQSGGLLSWTPSITMIDTTVYFWRVYSDTRGADSTISYFSFIYTPGQSGWNQSHPQQFTKNSLTSMVYENERIDYVSSVQEISIVNALTPSVLGAGYVATFFNNNLTDRCRCETENGVYVQVIDPNNFSLWTIPGSGNRFGAVNCHTSTATQFLFKTLLRPGQNSLEIFLRDSVPSGHYVMIYTLNNANVSNWPSSLVQLLDTYGSKDINNLKNETLGKPWAFFFKKGDPQYPYIAEKLANNRTDVITLSGKMTDNWYRGSIKSTLIGPSLNWDFADWSQSFQNNSANARGSINIFGVDENGNSSLLVNNLRANDTTLAAINGTTYPYLQLEWHNADSVNKVAPKLNYWRVSSDMVGELVYRTDQFVQGSNARLRAGDTLDISTNIQNIGYSEYDSILIKYYIKGRNQVFYKRIAGLGVGDSLRLPLLRLSAKKLSGNYVAVVEINPDRDQPEMYTNNNTLLIPFYVQPNGPTLQTDNEGEVVELDVNQRNNNRPMMPEGISPNNDGLNDSFVIKNIELYPENELIIYDRGGVEVARFKNYNNDWTGFNKNNNELPAGTYTALLKYKSKGKQEQINSQVQIRK